ncbi:IS66 family insertion sequence element accessory protein TnpB [Achromobacter sp. JUb104]|uniref:IS66 family insertion sequence element accessory protein TnpB n=1 Tax=Achromobacter sp. JUb104 TaxID=2940590 RepID=UPI0038577C4D
MRDATTRLVAVIRNDAIWLAVNPMDMRAGSATALARVVKVFGTARPNHVYVFANRRGNRMKVLIRDGIGVWLAARRLNKGRFRLAGAGSGGKADAHARATPGAGRGPALATHGRGRRHHRAVIGPSAARNGVLRQWAGVPVLWHTTPQ